MTASTPPDRDQPGELRQTPAADGVLLEYEVAGSGPPVVLLHGLFSGRAAFSRQRELASLFRLILPSTRAHDGTDGRLPEGYDIATTELDDLCAVLAAERLERFHLVGHSSGGTLAFAFARRFPERVDRLLLIEPTLMGLMHEPGRGQIRGIFGGFAETGRRQGNRAGLEAALAWLGGNAWSRLEPAKQAARLDAMAPMAHLIVPHMQSLVDFAATPEEVGRLAMPTQLIYGGASYAFEAELAARLRELRPDWPLLVVEGAGHNCFRDQPAVVNQAIREFLPG